jgi:hypothetical protein
MRTPSAGTLWTALMCTKCRARRRRLSRQSRNRALPCSKHHFPAARCLRLGAEIPVDFHWHLLCQRLVIGTYRPAGHAGRLIRDNDRRRAAGCSCLRFLRQPSISQLAHGREWCAYLACLLSDRCLGSLECDCGARKRDARFDQASQNLDLLGRPRADCHVGHMSKRSARRKVPIARTSRLADRSQGPFGPIVSHSKATPGGLGYSPQA